MSDGDSAGIRPVRGGALPYFVASFVAASLQSVIPQHHLASRPDDERFLVLSACLLAGAIGSVIGIGASRGLRDALSSLSVTTWRVSATLSCLALGLTFSGTWWITSSWLYVVCFFVVNALAQLVFDTLDRRLVRRAGGGLSTHVRRATALQLLAFVSGPLWFGALADTRAPHFVLVTVLVVLLAAVAWQVPGEAPRTEDATGAGELATSLRDEARRGLGRDAATFLAFGFLTYAAMFVFVASLFHLVKEHYGRADAAMVAGALVAASNVVAALTVAAVRHFGIRISDDDDAAPDTGWSPRLHLPTTAVMLTCVIVVVLRPFAHLAVLVACALPTGACYGLFLLRARAYASRRATVAGRATFLSRFNNLSNLAALFSFATMLALAELCRRLEVSHVLASVTTSGVLAGAALLVAAVAHRSRWRAPRR